MLQTEPVYSQIRKDRSRHYSGPSQSSPKYDTIDIYRANAEGLINHLTGEISVRQYGVSMLIDDAIIQGELI